MPPPSPSQGPPSNNYLPQVALQEPMGAKGTQRSMGTKRTQSQNLSILHPNNILKPNHDPNAHTNPQPSPNPTPTPTPSPDSNPNPNPSPN